MDRSMEAIVVAAIMVVIFNIVRLIITWMRNSHK